MKNKETDFSKIISKAKSETGQFDEKKRSSTTQSTVKIGQIMKDFPEQAKGIVVRGHEEKKESSTPSQEKTVSKQKSNTETPRAKLDDALRIAIDQYNDAYTMMNDTGSTLYRERTRAVDMIVHIEELVNSIANRPKGFDVEIAEIQTHRESFVGTCEFAKAELEAAKKSALGAGAGVATGAAIVSVAPTVAMWVATTFGTASTGTAISALSGAAATNAALAWLGGGALAAGGGGMAAGFEVGEGIMKMLGGFTVLRLTSMMGMVNVSFTKEELLKMNKKLNRIRKPKSIKK